MYVYIGVELSRKDSEKHIEGLEDLQKSLHVTFKFGIKEEEVEAIKNLLGTKVLLKIVAKGEYKKEVDGEEKLANIGWLVDKESFGPLKSLYENAAEPHVTLWISKEKDSKGKKIGKAMETKFCEFVACEPFEVEATFGLFDENNDFYDAI